MITETSHLENKQSNILPSTDKKSDFDNCENKNENIKFGKNLNFSSNLTSSSKLEENEYNVSNKDDEDNEDKNFSRPKKLQKSNNQALALSKNSNNQQNTKLNQTLGNSELTNSFEYSSKKHSNQLQATDKNTSSNSSSFNNNTNNINLNEETSNNSKNNLTNLNLNDTKDNKLINEESNQLNNESTCSPKVPPLRIVISSSSTSRNNSKESNNANSSDSQLSLSLGKNYVVSSAIATTNETNNPYSTRSTILNSTFYSATASTSSNISTSSSSSSTGRITRSQRAAAQNYQNDDSQNKFISDEAVSSSNDSSKNSNLSNNLDDNCVSNFKIEKESNKENKDLRKRKGRSKNVSSFSTSVNSNNLNTINNLDLSSQTNENVASDDSGRTNYLVYAPSTSNNNIVLNVTTSTSSSNGLINNLTTNKEFQMPTYNCYNMYQNIRKQVDKRRQNLCNTINPKAPQGFKNYLLNTGNYILDNNSESNQNVKPNLTFEQINTPELLKNKKFEKLIDLYKTQELERERMKVQHMIEKQKVKLSIEQEILRVHSRAALAMANQSMPFSFATIMRDEEIYNTIDNENENGFHLDGGKFGETSNTKETSKNEYSRATYSCLSNNSFADLYTLTGKNEDIGSRCRYSGRLLHSWLQDVEDKWIKIKKEMIYRHRREAEALHAVQKLNWEWKVKELFKKIELELEDLDANCQSIEKFDSKNWLDKISNLDLVPLIGVNEDFDFN